MHPQEAPYDAHQVSEKLCGMNLTYKKNLLRGHQDVREYLRRRDRCDEHRDHTRADTQNQIDDHRHHFR